MTTGVAAGAAVRAGATASLAALLALTAGLPGTVHAASTRYCDAPAPLNAAQHDKLLRVAAVIKDELHRSGRRAVLIARSGTDLSRFGVRYSHAGVSLLDSAETPWTVRQLYYACDEDKPRLFDQGLSAFLLGNDEPTLGYVSVLLLPAQREQELARAALDKRVALGLLATTYSANAYAFNLRYQNCNQWVAELLAAAWGAPADSDEPRAQAQRWLHEQAYSPSAFDVGWQLLMWLGNAIPWVHSDDHPPEDLAQAVYRVSMPASIEAFVQNREPGAQRLEFCHNAQHIVVHRGWTPVADGCVPGEGDTVIALD